MHLLNKSKIINRNIVWTVIIINWFNFKIDQCNIYQITRMNLLKNGNIKGSKVITQMITI